jgi:hypothetical protein
MSRNDHLEIQLGPLWPEQYNLCNILVATLYRIIPAKCDRSPNRRPTKKRTTPNRVVASANYGLLN